MRSTAVVGAGTMGTGIAQCLATAGYRVVVVDTDADSLVRAQQALRDALRLALLLGRGDRAALTRAPERIEWTTDNAALRDTEFVIECVTEVPAVKTSVFAELGRVCGPATVLASCTSAIPIAGLAAVTAHPERVLGLHIMNPAPLTGTVEVVRGAQTGAEVLDTALAVVAEMGKNGIVVPDRPGFVINRVLMLSIVEAVTALADGVTAATVDALFEGCLGHTTGPLRTADLIGLDNVIDTLAVLRAELGDDRYIAPPALTALVAAGRYGRKTGQGFHDYR
ncbi:3-hydroxyacyl-CoA dehydrogenase family protein [Nocardia carnea]|uniref:3-hydroxyacyl-CoA dehydrogenase family protein n=1 Tax=Nocardia carnea TaxID=37328 RepID=UPI002455EBDD|nr:3-hydroxyacyl-CoA dehydrogenase family protein [Nocardia carnea]